MLDDANAEPKSESNYFYYKDKKGIHPKRNSFTSLLEILATGNDGILDENEKKTMQNTRNAFGHNTYDVNFDSVFKGKEEKKKIPEVANGIKDKIVEQTKDLKENLQ